MISVPDELKKKLTACRRSVSRLTDWRWDIERAEALRTELRSLNDDLSSIFINILSQVDNDSQFNDFEDSDDYVLSEIPTFIDIPRAHLSMLAQILSVPFPCSCSF